VDQITLEPAGHFGGWLAAIAQYAISLPGVRPSEPLDLSGYIQVPYSAALNPSGGQITIEGWVKRSGTNRNETILGNGWQTSYWLGFSPTGKLRFIPHGSDSTVDGNATVASGEWVHVAVTYDGVTRRYYINGVLDKTSTASSGALTPAPAGRALGIGFDVNDTFTPNYFGGWIDTCASGTWSGTPRTSRPPCSSPSARPSPACSPNGLSTATPMTRPAATTAPCAAKSRSATRAPSPTTSASPR
jgi:hypothetical protein